MLHAASKIKYSDGEGYKTSLENKIKSCIITLY